ncbi:class I SAM-dependent methyltransferase [Sandaracinobacteroides saxicola]|uniref:SAM-dependent methyltransferase n=1 Tax=Sandaracinobacteroides saxicola TaxID=2759707 RepID=A0A7G5IKD3_9SPHN|nr:SAM-dependent methyltransferase [Sandaracinobacteroides saxicola]QMW23825.1 SAM-dependent methyltransferase [Sandaracinobacteroides saxicola]
MDDIFDRRLRARARDRAAPMIAGHDFLLRLMADELDARADLLGADRTAVLTIGGAVPGEGMVVDAGARWGRDGVVDEDRLRLGGFTLVKSVGVLHGVNDVPGALVAMRRALRPGGRMLAACVAGEALMAVRRAFFEAEDALTGRVGVRVGPTIDPAQAAGLLARAGFAEPVADVETVTARYPDLTTLARELRGMGETGWLAARPRVPMRRDLWAAASARFAAQADADGKVPVSVQLLVLSGRVA